MTDKLELWLSSRKYTPEKLAIARQVLDEVRSGSDVLAAIRRHPLPGGGHVAKHALVAVYRAGLESGEWEEDNHLLTRIRMKPMRTLSGVTTVTVLTKPYPCPGECIFCPTDVRMPKSYLPDEPGAARGFQNDFDPYDQVQVRLADYNTLGHPSDKIELLILGGTWSAYRKDYQEWFVKRCFDAMNGVDAETLAEAHRINETAAHRNVGLVIETRPDRITPKEIAWLRYLGVTKVQMGVQSLDDNIQEMNRRGHTNAETLAAAALLRAAGFKIVVHWMPNLLGATLESDRADFVRLWSAEEGGLGVSPDELKIYPTQLLESAELYQYWQRGEYHPYTTEQLVELIADIKPIVPEYCRINRVIRDIPSTHVVEGNKRTSLRMDVIEELKRRGQSCRCIRCREVRGQKVSPEHLRLVDQVYHPAYAEEHFLTYVTPDDQIAGYLRLSLPARDDGGSTAMPALSIPDLEHAALIREVHVYGQSLPVGGEQQGAAQHSGLGTALLAKADEIARQAGFQRMAVIAAVGTRQYYEARGFERGELYMVKEIGTL
jgi:elongator complex protein 3